MQSAYSCNGLAFPKHTRRADLNGPHESGVIKLVDAPALHAHEMIVMAALVQLEYRLAGLEMMALETAGLFELGEDAVDRGQPDVQSLVDENPIDVLGGQVADLAVFESFSIRSRGPVAFRPLVFKSWTLVTEDYLGEDARFRYDIAFYCRGNIGSCECWFWRYRFSQRRATLRRASPLIAWKSSRGTTSPRKWSRS